MGSYDACGLCNGPGAIYDCGCEDIPDGDCDCDGNQPDALGICGETCTAYSEDFESYPDNYGWGSNGANSGGFDGTETNWSLSGDDNGDYWYVNTVSGNNLFEGKDLDGESVWTSKSISVSGMSDLAFSIDVSQYSYSVMESADYIRVYVIADGGSESLLFEQTNDLSSATTWSSSVSATSTVQFRVRAKSSSNDERWRFDNLELTANTTDVDSDGLCDVIDDCTDTSALNYADATATECLYEAFHEPFDDDSQFSKNVSFSHDGNADYWGIWDNDGSSDDFDGNSGEPSSIPTFGGIEGNILVGEDMNAAPVVANPGILTWSNIDISGFDADLTFEIDIAESGATSNERVELYAKLSSSGSYVLMVDPGDNIGSIGSTLTKHTGSGTFDGSSLDLQLIMVTPDGGDELAVDDIRILGTQSCAQVAVGSATSPTVDLDSGGSVSVTAAASGADIDVTTSGDCFTVSGYEVSKTGASSGFGSSVSFDCSETGAQDVWVRVTDGGSNSSAALQTTVTVQDVTVPTFSSASGATVDLDSDGAATITASATYVSGAADNCSGQGLTYLVSDAEGGTYAGTIDLDCNDLGSKTLWFKVQDASGNLSAASSASFTVQDVTAPSYSTSGSTFNLSVGSVSVAFSDVTSGLADACDASPTTEVSKNNADWSSSVSYDCTDAGTSPTLYVRATDASGNENASSVSITISDNTAPAITALTPTSVQLSTGAATVATSGLTFTASDDCTDSGSLTYTVSTSSGGTYSASVALDCDDIGTVTLYFKAEDASGNLSAAFSQDFTVTDATSLTAIGQDITVSLDANGSYSLLASEVNNGSVGNCNTSLSVSPNSFTCNELGANVVTLTISDGASSDNTNVTVTVEDNTKPNASQLPGGTFSKNLSSIGSGSIAPEDVYVGGNPIDRCTADENLTIQIKRVGGDWGSTVSVDCNDVGTPFSVDVGGRRRHRDRHDQRCGCPDHQFGDLRSDRGLVFWRQCHHQRIRLHHRIGQLHCLRSIDLRDFRDRGRFRFRDHVRGGL